MIKNLVPVSGGFSAALAWSVSNFTNPYEVLIRGSSDDVSVAQKALPINSKFTANVTWEDGTVEVCHVTVLNSPVMTANRSACRFSTYVRRQPAKPAGAKTSGAPSGELTGELTGAELGAILNR